MGEQWFDEIESDGVRLHVARIGAEPVSIAKKRGQDWVGFLHRDGDVSKPASGWANHATVMGYFLHRLWQEQSTYRGKSLQGGNHGFLRHFAFAAPDVLEDGLAYHVPPDQIPPAAYPLRVPLTLRFRISGGTVRVEFEFRNLEDVPAHVSFGLHPGFAIGSLAEARVLLPPGEYVRHFAPGNFLDGRTETLPFSGGEMPFAKSALPDSYLIALGRVPQRDIVLESPARGTRVRFDFSEVPYLTLWSDAKDFICIEPCWGLPDSNPPVPFEEKIGIQVIPPRGTLLRGFSIQPEFLP